MEDVLEGVVIPHWCFGSIVLLVFTMAAAVLSILTLLQLIRYIANKQGDDIIKSLLVVLVLSSLYRGLMYYKAIGYWIYTLLRISSTPPLDVLEYGMIIQENIVMEAVRAFSHIAVYFLAYMLLKRANHASSKELPSR